MKPTRRTRLPVQDLHKLLVALDGPIDPEDLVAVSKADESSQGPLRSVHAEVLSWFMCAGNDEVEDLSARCCLKLIAMSAPLTDTYGDGAAVQFCHYTWPVESIEQEPTSRLADAYVAAGLWNVDARLAGETPAGPHNGGSFSDGRKPLASAIITGDRGLAKYVVDRGASMDLGCVYAGGPPVNAIDLALEEGQIEIRSMLIAALMKRKLESCQPASVASIESYVRASEARGSRRRVL